MGFFKTVAADIRAIRERDPAVKGRLEAVLCYPGLHALTIHRIAHRFYRWKLKLPARIINTITRFLTGVDIHPGAQIGKGIFIDHAHGVVIGETAVIGNNVTILHQVTLGGTGKETGKRHPTIRDGVLIGAGAKILGSVTIGENTKIGSGAVVVRDVPPDCSVVGNPGRIVRLEGRRVPSLQMDSANLPDPVLDKIRELESAIKKFHTTEIASLALPKVLGEVHRDVLAEICENTRRELKSRKEERPVENLEIPAGFDKRNFLAALKNPGVSLIAEFKRKSPSAGEIRPGAEPAEIARLYEQSGAAAISVLTEERYFGGSLEDLAKVRAAVSLPVLRKDFIIDEYQLYEAAAAGAAAVLLIVAALDGDILRFYEKAAELGLDSLVEVHTAEEIEQALALPDLKILGINNRDLKTMTTDIRRGIELVKNIPDERRAEMVVVAESGIKTRDDVIMLAEAGFDAVLVGEILMKTDDPGKKIGELLGVGEWNI